MGAGKYGDGEQLKIEKVNPAFVKGGWKCRLPK